MIRLTTPLDKKTRESLKVGDRVLLTGRIFTARDAAHKRFCELIAQGKKLPFSLENELLYFVGPTPKRPDGRVGAAGPTTSSRMDQFSTQVIEHFKIGGMIGKGDRSPEVVQAMVQHQVVYFVATGGAGALLAKTIQSMKPVLYEELGPEAVHEVYVQDFPMVVGIDCQGHDLYVEGPAQFRGSCS